MEKKLKKFVELKDEFIALVHKIEELKKDIFRTVEQGLYIVDGIVLEVTEYDVDISNAKLMKVIN